METYPIVSIRLEMRRGTEQLGSKPKFWFRFNEQDWLFKEARINTGEDWSEKVASEIAKLIGLPTHHSELAEWQGKRGCAVLSFLQANEILVHGNELLGGWVERYDAEKTYGQTLHTLDNIVKVFELYFEKKESLEQSILRMVGYLIFDALVGNTDRHHQNWGFHLKQVGISPNFSSIMNLAPTYDHASSLGRELTDEARARYLRENSISRYVMKGAGGIYETVDSKKGMNPMNLVELLSKRYPEHFRFWQAKISQLSGNDWCAILNRVPDSRISTLAREFACAFLAESHNRLMKMV